MLLAGISSQHKKIPPAKNVMQTTIKQVTKLTVPLNPEKSLNPGITSDAEISTSLRFGYPECVQLAEIVCDDDQSAATDMASNHLVIRPDRCSLAGQFGTDLTGMYRCLKGHVGFDDQAKNNCE